MTSVMLLSVWNTTAQADDYNGDNAIVKRTIKGVVLDETGTALPGASIIVEGTTIGAGTNAKGEFTLQLREKGAQRLRISFTGYETQEYLVDASDNSLVTIRLTPSENLLTEVVVTGSHTEKPLKETPVLTRVISQRDIQTLNPMDIETLLQYELPGLQIGYDNMSQLPTITYQGVGGEYLLFLVDGERISGEGSDHNVDFTRLNIDDIERIEVIKGSQSTLYGSNALGGVINIITKSANRPFTGNVNARYAGSNGQKYSIGAGTKQSRFSSYSNLTYRTRDTYTVGDDEGKKNTIVNPDGSIGGETIDNVQSTTVYGYQIWDASQKFGYSFTDKLSAELKGSFYHNQRDIRTGKVYQDLFIDYAVNAKVKYLFNINHQLEASYIYDNYKKDKNYFNAGFTRTDYRNRTQSARISYTGIMGDHTLSAGIETNLEYLKHYMMKDSADASMETYVLYLQEDWKVTDRVNLIAGLRSDYHDKYGLHVTPKLSTMYRPCEVFTLRASYSMGFRSPSLKELYQEYFMGGFMWLYGNPDLNPETSHQFALSAEAEKGGFNASVSAYHNRFRDKIGYARADGGMKYVNAEKARTTGVEGIIRYRMEFGLMLTGSYAYVNDYEEIDGHNASSVRPHSLTFNASYNHKFGKIGVNAALNGQWTSKLSTYSINQDQTYERVSYDPRTLCSFNAGVQLPRGISLNFGIDNLLNYKDKAADSSLQLPQKGISYVGTVNINLADMFNL